MNYEEFHNLTLLNSNQPLLARLYSLSSGELFYIEPIFYTQLTRIIERFPMKEEEIVNFMLAIVKKEKKVVFTGDFEYSLINKEDFIYREISDITNPLQIYVNDISRGSDYGD
ncbi:MAG: hypothetical protein PHP09_01935 [Bacilli bacterium]|nr:hypothetical protein [Bacilli bacterium]MDD4344687.1 hypothetical protein [Bacilli bacterium]MDD4520868.1 hypothetical protein [Bacilli bacterium]